jgi:predicted metalloendopeptidase
MAGTIVPACRVPLTDDQLFFVAFAQLWCEKMTDESALHQLLTDPHSLAWLLTDPHSLAWLRVRGTISNHPIFRLSQGLAHEPRNKVQRVVIAVLAH